MADTTTYKIASGDTASAIAKKYGTTIQQLQAANPQYSQFTSNANYIQAGWTLNLPTAAPISGGTTNTEGQIRTNPQTGQQEIFTPGGVWEAYSKNLSDKQLGANVSSTIKTDSGVTASFSVNEPKEGDTRTNPTTGKQEMLNPEGNWVEVTSGMQPAGQEKPADWQSSSTGLPGGDTGDGNTGDGNTGDGSLPDFYQKQIDEYKAMTAAQAATSEAERQATIDEITANTNYNRDLIQQSYDKSVRDVKAAMLLLPGLVGVPQARVSEITAQLTDLSANYITNLTKINADYNIAIEKGDVTKAQELEQQQKDYFGFVSDTMNSYLNYEEKQTNYARERVNTLSSTGAIASLDDTQLMSLAKQSGYSMSDLAAMREAAVTKGEATEERLAMAEERVALAEEKTSKTEAINNVLTEFAAHTGSDQKVDWDTYREQRQKSTLSPTEFDKRFGGMLSPEGQIELGVTKAGQITTSKLNTLAAYGVPSSLANWIAQQQTEGASDDEIITAMLPKYPNAASILQTYNTYMQYGYSSKVTE